MMFHPLPDLMALKRAESHVFAFKGLWECNWLQALEVVLTCACLFYIVSLKDEDPKDQYVNSFEI